MASLYGGSTIIKLQHKPNVSSIDVGLLWTYMYFCKTVTRFEF